MKLWQRVFLFGSAFGISFAIVLSIIFCGIYWYSERPAPWNNKAITAEFNTISTEGEQNFLEVNYVLKNNTDKDWEVSENDKIRGVFTNADKELSPISKSTWVTIDKPLFIPAKHKMNVDVHFALKYPIPLKDNPTPDERDKYQKAIEKWLSSEYPRLDGFIFFDETNRYEISLPAGWKEAPKKKSIK